MARPQEPERSSHRGLAAPPRGSTRERRRARPTSSVLELLHPGSFVKLRQHPSDLPPFQLIRCQGGRCWVRQQSWGPLVHWEVPHRQLKSLDT